MLAVRGGLHQPRDLLAAQDLGLSRWRLDRGDREVRPGSAQGDLVAEAQSVHGHAQRTPGQPPLRHQRGKIGLHLCGTQCVGGSALVFGQADHSPDVGLLRKG